MNGTPENERTRRAWGQRRATDDKSEHTLGGYPCQYENRYLDALRTLPPSGGGGCHGALLGVANYGVLAGRDDAEILHHIRMHLTGTRRVPDSEIMDAIDRARRDANPGQWKRTFHAKQTPDTRLKMIQSGRETLARYVEKAGGAGLAEIHDSSPISLHHDNGAEDAAMLLEAVYADDELIFCGENCGAGIVNITLRTASQWRDTWGKGIPTPPQIILNPLSGRRCKKKGGDGWTRRGDASVAAFRFLLLEFDGTPIEEQAAFLIGAQLPLWAIIHSGGKSLHAWVDTRLFFGEEITTLERWDALVAHEAKPIIQALGADPACCTASRLGRLPGHFRREKGAWQRLLWLSDKPGEVMK